MKIIYETYPLLAQYHVSLCLISVLILIALIQNFLCAPFAFLKEEQLPGIPTKGDHALFSFRVIRTYQNSVENLPLILGTVLLGIIANIASGSLNWLVAIYVLARIAFWAIYYSGIGKAAGGPRTMAYVIGLITNIILIVMTLYKFMVY